MSNFLALDDDKQFSFLDALSKADSDFIHAPFDDPPALATGCVSDADRLRHYTRVRDEIRQFVEKLPQLLRGPGTSSDAG